MKTNFDIVYYIDGKKAVKLSAFSRMINYRDNYLLHIIKNLFKKKIYIAYKWKRNYYVFLPPQNLGKKESKIETVNTPKGDELKVDWDAAIAAMPSEVAKQISKISFSNLVIDSKLYTVSSQIAMGLSSTLTSKTWSAFTPLNLGIFKATTSYSYGNYIIYDKDKMSTFNPGTSGTLHSTQIPQAFFEVCRALDAAENSRNGANPGLTAKRNVSTTVSFDSGTIAVAATLPVIATTQTDGSIKISASDYLGITYSSFANGGGDLKSVTLPEALMEIASFLAAAEKAVTPTEAQPNNVQITVDLETSSATISANIPFTTAASNSGDVTIKAIDYLILLTETFPDI